MSRLFFLYALSGFVSLGYQVAWFRILTDWFGSTNLTFALVVCCFIGGLGLGALWSKPVVNWLSQKLGIDSRLRLYGLVELFVAVTAALTLLMSFLPADIWGPFPYQETGGVWVKSIAYQIGQALVAIVCVLLPCLFMGITFPLLCDAFVGGKNADRLPSALYAWNTLGACSGVVVCQFFLLTTVGHSSTFVLMVAINAILGIYFLWSGGGEKLQLAAGARDSEPVKNDQGDKLFPGNTGLLFTAALLSGLIAGAVEGDMFKRVTLVLGNNPGATMPAISFWAILGIFLASATVRALPKLGLNHIKFCYVLAIICYWLAWEYAYPVYNGLEATMSSIRETQTFDATPAIAMFPGSMLQLFLFVGGFVFLPFYLISLLLPWICNHLQADRRHLGLAYGLNTLAFCIGMIGFVLLAPMASIFYSLKLVFVLLVLGLLLLLAMQEHKKLAWWKPAAFAGAFFASAMFVPAEFDRDYVNPGLPPAKHPVTAMRSNGAVTSFVVTSGPNKHLFFGNTSMSGTSPIAQTYMRLMAHFPLLAQNNPTKALLICFGVGNTASAIAKHDTISTIDIVDLNINVFETASEFAATNHNVIEDPRVRLINDDGRAYLKLSDERYDLITSEPPPPMAAGVYRLYSHEYYQDALDHLTPSGVMTQWLPYYQLPPEAVARVIDTFIDVFPHALLFTGAEEELILVGGSQPLNLDLLSERFSITPTVVEDLAGIVVSEPTDLYARLMQVDAELRRNYAGSGFISDENNTLEHMFPGWGRIPVISYNPSQLLSALRSPYPAVANQLEPIVTHLGRLNFRVPKFPLYGVEADEDVKYSDADWTSISRLYSEGMKLLARRDQKGAAKKFIDALAYAPESPLLLSYVGQLYLDNDQWAQAEASFRRAILVEPNSPALRVWFADAIARQGRVEEAIVEYRRALAIDPKNAAAKQGLKRIL